MPKLSTVTNFIKNHGDAFTDPAMRWMIFNESNNGLKESGAILRNGRRVLIDEEKFFAWLQSRQQGVAA